MVRVLGFLALLSVLACLSDGCAPTPEPTEPLPTQTPWIVVVTATPGPESVARVQPTQTPWIIVATPTRPKGATATPTRGTTASPGTAAAPTATEEPPTPTASPPAVSGVEPSPTDTPAPEAIKYPPPVLLDPPPGGRVPWRSRIVLKWDPVGELAEDEYYRLELDRPPTAEAMQPYGDYVFLKEAEYLLEGSFLAPFHPPENQGEATLYWWIRIVRKTGEDENGKPVGVDISAPSDRWTLIVEPKPEDS